MFRPLVMHSVAGCAALAAALTLGLSAMAQSAPGADERVLVRTEAAGKAVTVSVQPADPVAGLAHFVAVFEPATDVNEVRLFGQPPEGERETVRMLDEPGAPGRFVANFEFSSAGTWAMEVQFQAGTARSSAPFLVEVGGLTRSAGRAPLGTAVWALITLAIIGGGAWLVWTARKARAGRAA